MKRCEKCLLPRTVPGADFDVHGVCAYCRGERTPEEFSGIPQGEALDGLRRDFERALETVRQGHGGRHDALVCLSGGKDSLYLLHRARVDWGLNVLAFTTDVNLPELAWDNIRRTVAKLQVDHLVYRPPSDFYRKLFRHLLCNQEERGAVYTVSYVYAPLFEGDAMAVAAERRIPLVLAGYSPGQPDPKRMFYEFDESLLWSTDWTPPGLAEDGSFSAAELRRFWNPTGRDGGEFRPRYLAPFHVIDYEQDEVIEKVYELGLVKARKNASPVFSNYPINWLLMYSDLRNLGYNPYAPEFSTLIREGRASKRYWQVMAPVVDMMIQRRLFLGRHVTEHLRWLQLSDDDLRINRPRGAYDPVRPAPDS